MDRVIVYDGALFQTTDILNTNIYGLVDSSFQNQAILGTSTVVSGLAVTPTVPASLQVNVANGSIFTMDPTDQNAYGDLGTNTNNIFKMGILPTAITMPAITPPSTSGFSQVFLVEAILNDIDAGSLVLSYYNSANPSQPWAGPNNSGSSNFTIRQCRCVIALKAGVAATTGSQVTPSPDAGYTGLFAITVTNGQTQITSTSIAQLITAPFFPTLPQVPYGVQQGTYVFVGTDTGTANNYVISFGVGQPIPTAYTTGMIVKFAAHTANTGNSVINVQGLGNVTIHRATGVALASGDISSGQIVELTYDGTFFQMTNYLGSGTNTNSSTTVNIPYIADTGTQNAIIANFSPAITSGQQVAGLIVSVKLANTITGACTINVNSLGVKNVTLGDLTNPPYNLFTANMDLVLEYDGTEYQIINTNAGMFYRRPTSNYTIYVNTATGNDTLYDGTSATVVGGTSTAGPLKTISKAILVAWSYAPSQFTITIQVAAGTYNETVSTPGYAGPNVIINGVATTSVFVNGGSTGGISVTGPNTLTVQNLTVYNNGAPNEICFGASSGSTLNTFNTANSTTNGVFESTTGATINVGNHTVNAASGAVFTGAFGGTCNVNPGAVIIIGAPISCNVGFASAYGGQCGFPNGNPPTFINPSFVSGPKFVAQLNGVIYCYTLGVNFLPGSQAGFTEFGGQYLP